MRTSTTAEARDVSNQQHRDINPGNPPPVWTLVDWNSWRQSKEQTNQSIHYTTFHACAQRKPVWGMNSVTTSLGCQKGSAEPSQMSVIQY